jgi:formiminotetrahydrofolate cyclodeaminase
MTAVADNVYNAIPAGLKVPGEDEEKKSHESRNPSDATHAPAGIPAQAAATSVDARNTGKGDTPGPM